MKALTGGKGVPVVYDSVGKDTFMRVARLPAAARADGELRQRLGRGYRRSSSASLSQKGSLYVTRPTLVTHTAKRDDLVASAKDLFDVVSSGKVKIEINHRYPLKDAAQAHRDLEARKTTGSTILDPVATRHGRARRSGVSGLFPEIEPRASGMLRLDALHSMYWEECGRRDGIPRGFPARGPGCGQHAQAPALFRSGRLPHHRLRPARRGALETARGAARQHHAAPDCRPGGAAPRTWAWNAGWCSAAPGAARWRSPTREAHPERCLGLILRGIFLCRSSEIEWFLYGLRSVFPEPWEKFSGFLPPAERADLLANYHRRLVDPDPRVHMPAARAWSVYEGSCSTLLPSAETVAYFAGDVVALGLARIEAHYFVNDIFLEENALLEERRTGSAAFPESSSRGAMTWSARSCPRTSCIAPGRRPTTGSCPTPGTRRGSRESSARSSKPPSASSACSPSRSTDGAKKRREDAAFFVLWSCSDQIPRIFIAFAKRVDRLLVLARLVQGFTIGAELLDVGRLLRGQLRVLCHRLVDLLHVGGAMEGKRGSAREHERAKQGCKTNLHPVLLFKVQREAAYACRFPRCQHVKRRRRQTYSGWR